MGMLQCCSSLAANVGKDVRAFRFSDEAKQRAYLDFVVLGSSAYNKVRSHHYPPGVLPSTQTLASMTLVSAALRITHRHSSAHSTQHLLLWTASART